MTPSLSVPPDPHRFLRCVASTCISACFSGTPVMIVTPLPFRPFVSRPTRTVPSPTGTLACLHVQ